MPQLVSTALNDGVADVTFNPAGINAEGVASLVDNSLGIKSLESRLTIQTKPMGNGGQRVRIRLSVPKVVTNTTTSLQEVADINVAEIEFRFGADSTEAERDTIIAMMKDAMDGTTPVLTDVLSKLENVW